MRIRRPVRRPWRFSLRDLSGGGVTGWSWDFGDGETSTEQHPSHIYASPGIFSVTVTVSGAAGSSSDTTLVNLIRVPPLAGFTADPLVGEDSLNVAFSDTSWVGNAWSWSFGDGDSAFVQHPSHTYRNVGLYTVSLGDHGSERVGLPGGRGPDRGEAGGCGGLFH